MAWEIANLERPTIKMGINKAILKATINALLSRNASLSSLINNALNETMCGAFEEIKIKRVTHKSKITFREAAYKIGIEKIANTYTEMGIFP